MKITHNWVTIVKLQYCPSVLGGELARQVQRYIAVIADMVGSRRVNPSRRRALQERFSDLIDRFNRDYRRSIASKFIITLGDEFQGLLNSSTLIPDFVWRLEQEIPQCEFRIGVGLGTLDTALQKYAINIDGPALHTARAAIDQAKKIKVLGGIFKGFGELDYILNGVAGVLWFQRNQWTGPQREIASLLRQGLTQIQVAKKLRIKKQVVSRQFLASGYAQYAAAENAWRMILEKQADSLLGSKHEPTYRH